MEIIGEKINGLIPSVAQAIEERSVEKIRTLAITQTEAGAHYLNICAGTRSNTELDILKWLLDVVQSAVETPICVDSSNASVLANVIGDISHAGIVNSVSNEGDKCEIIYPLIANTDWKVVALTCNDSGIPADSAQKISIGIDLIEKAKTYGIDPSRVYIDPLVFALSAVNNTMINFTDAIRGIKAEYPTVHFVSGLANISFGMPKRKLIDQNFLSLAMSVGMDSAIMDPSNKELYSTIVATEALIGKDLFFMKYAEAFQAGRL